MSVQKDGRLGFADRATDAPHGAADASPPSGSVSTGAGCDCLALVNEKLAPHNSVVLTTFYPMVRPLIETAKIDTSKRGRPTLAVATFCPFCGVKYPAASGMSAEGQDAQRLGAKPASPAPEGGDAQ